MTRVLVLLAALAALVTAVAAARVRLAVSPIVVAPGARVRVVGNAAPCPRGDIVTAISRAFPGHRFGGEGTLSGRVGTGGAFGFAGRVRRLLPRGRYAISARCGGGNLGVTAYLRVR